MGKYLVLWEVDSTRAPVDAKERGTLWLGMANMVREDMQKGMIKDWGTFPGELCGYSIEEGSEIDVMKSAMQYAPYIRFKVHPVASLDQVEQAIQASM